MDMGCDGLHLVFHFGMTGKFIYNAEPGKYDHLVFFLEDNNTLNFNDPRRFGGAFITYDIEKALSDLGPEPLEKVILETIFSNL